MKRLRSFTRWALRHTVCRWRGHQYVPFISTHDEAVAWRESPLRYNTEASDAFTGHP